MNFEVDLYQRWVIGWNLVLVAALRDRGVPAAIVDWLPPLLPLLEISLLVAVLAAIAVRLERLWDEGPGEGAWRWVGLAAMAAAGLYALRLLYWLYLHPSHDLAAVVSRWDYLVFAVAGGLVLNRAPVRARTWALAALSVVLVCQYYPLEPLRVLFGACLLGFAATRWHVTRRPGVRVVVHTVLMGAVLAWLLSQRAAHPWEALNGWGLYSFVVWRHVSFVVESARGVPSTFVDYVCYLLFFPNCIGAMEVYDEFHERNLATARAAEFARAALMMIRGNALIWLGLVIPMSEDRVTTSPGFASMWSTLLVLYFRAAIGTIGTWDVIEGGALFLGFRLRPNFRHVLQATTPSQFWRAWRATMTNSLIRYVYIPLGGNRRHQTVNIFAAFFVSTVWHCLGVPFLRPDSWTPYELVPIITWGGVNAAAVATHARVRRRWPPSPRGGAMLAGKWALAMVFGSLTVLLLGFSLGHVDRFGHVVRTLLGLHGW
jgi:D-alanyl-lipoteichoic acid acyltransferase DltB (MBOAT superfamily)